MGSAELSLWTRFLEASVEDMLPMEYIDARTTKFYFCELFFVVPIFASRETSEKIPTEWLFLRKMVVLQETYLALGRWLLAAFALLAPASYHQAADVGKADDQTGIASGSSPPRTCQEIALGLYCTAFPTWLRVPLHGPLRGIEGLNSKCPRPTTLLYAPWV